MERFKRWRKGKISERPFVFILAAVLGLGAGVMAWALKSAIAFISEIVSRSIHPLGPDWLLLLMPVTGVMITVFLCTKVFHANLSYGVRVITHDIRNHNPFIPAQMTFSPLVATSFTLGFGGSAGSEGPIAFSGAALGSTLARKLGLSASMSMMMLGCGAGAGIAAIFKAPIGGALFTLEVLRMGLGSFGCMVLLLSTVIASLTAIALSGFSLELAVANMPTYDPHLILWTVLLGLLCGAYSLYYSYIMKLIEHVLDKIRSRWVKGLISGSLVGLLLMLFPAFYGEGFSVMRNVIDGNFAAIAYGSIWENDLSEPMVLFVIASCILLIKCFITSLSYNGGGVTGEFAPTLFAGCFAGYVFGAGCNALFGIHLPVGQMAFLGMAGVMAGAIRAPLMSMFVVTEMSSAFYLLLPVTIVAGLSFGVVRLFTADSFFSKEMDRSNGLLRRFIFHRK